jgi:REP element-mobilizing transposase RayT
MGYPHRIKPEGETWYHLYASTAAKGGEYPLEPDWIREKFRQTFIFYARAYRLNLGAFCIMGNHFHLVVRVDEKKLLLRE